MGERQKKQHIGLDVHVSLSPLVLQTQSVQSLLLLLELLGMTMKEKPRHKAAVSPGLVTIRA